jgi:hypothetical protein
MQVPRSLLIKFNLFVQIHSSQIYLFELQLKSSEFSLWKYKFMHALQIILRL